MVDEGGAVDAVYIHFCKAFVEFPRVGWFRRLSHMGYTVSWEVAYKVGLLKEDIEHMFPPVQKSVTCCSYTA